MTPPKQSPQAEDLVHAATVWVSEHKHGLLCSPQAAFLAGAQWQAQQSRQEPALPPEGAAAGDVETLWLEYSRKEVASLVGHPLFNGYFGYAAPPDVAFKDGFSAGRQSLRGELEAAGRITPVDWKKWNEAHDPKIIAELDSLLSTAQEKLKGAELEAADARDMSAEWERLAHEWMADYDKLKNKYEPMVAVPSDALSPQAAQGENK